MRYSNFALFLISIFGNISYSNCWCRGDLSGDCNVDLCGGNCESKYVRYFDRFSKVDRTVRSCACEEKDSCSSMGILRNGCKTYPTMSYHAQRYIRLWSMEREEREKKRTNPKKFKFIDRIRHSQLMSGNSLFCCRSPSPTNPLSLQLRSSSSSKSLIIFMLIALIFYTF